ncbi:MAG: hypothetical protein OXC56_04630 [Chloroflexi bacterium]|nr:hypothetical protein [Chloroflexota bacterium]
MIGNVFRLYLPVFGGLVAGAWIGGVVLAPEPAVFGWIFGAGAGLMGGAFLAAIVGGVALAGSGGGVRHSTFPGDELGYDDGDDWDDDDN